MKIDCNFSEVEIKSMYMWLPNYTSNKAAASAKEKLQSFLRRLKEDRNIKNNYHNIKEYSPCAVCNGSGIVLDPFLCENNICPTCQGDMP